MTEAPSAFPPYCGAFRAMWSLKTPTGLVRYYDHAPAMHPLTPQMKAAGFNIDVEVKNVCTRACHPVSEQHVDVERGTSWGEPRNPLVRNPFEPSDDV